MRCPVSAANRRSRISARQGSLLPAGRVRRPRFPHLAFGPHPSRHGSESASSHPPPCQKDVRRGVRRRDRGQRPQLQKIRIRNDYAGGDAATVAGHVGPGFHHWPPSHIPQAPDTNALIRIRRVGTGPKTRSARRSERRAPPRSSPFFPSPTGRLRGQRPQLQKKSGNWES